MALRLSGEYPQPIPLLRTWIEEHVGRAVWTQLPADSGGLLPLIMISHAPSGGVSGYELQAALDIDVYATGHEQADPLMSRIEKTIALLQGDGNRYGYVDSCSMSGFMEITATDPSILRHTATVTLTLRLQ